MAAASSATKLFVGQVPKTLSMTDLSALFAQFGEVIEAVAIKDKGTGGPSGACFVNMTSKEAAQAAIDGLNNKVVLPGGKQQIVVRYAGSNVPPDEVKLYVGMLDRSTTEEEIQQLFETYGAVKEVFLMKDKETGQSKGCGFVKFMNRDDAVNAINALHDRHKDKRAPSNIIVKFAFTKAEKAQQQPAASVAQYYPQMMMPFAMGNQMYQPMMGYGMPNQMMGMAPQAQQMMAQQWQAQQAQYAQPAAAAAASPYATAPPAAAAAAQYPPAAAQAYQAYGQQQGYGQYR